MTEFEFKLASGKRVIWEGKDWEDAAHRYVDCHRDEAIIAWRNYQQPLVIGLPRWARG